VNLQLFLSNEHGPGFIRDDLWRIQRVEHLSELTQNLGL
jgi:hypothetical protein